VVAREGRVAVDAAARLPGRGAWLHPDPECFRTAIERKAFGRALKTAITEQPAVHDLADLEERAERPMDD